MLDTFYTNTAQFSEHLLRDPAADANLSARTVTYSLAPASGGTAIASGNASYVTTVVTGGVTYYKFRVTITAAQAAEMAVDSKYVLTVSEAVSGASAAPVGTAKINRGE